GLQPAGAQLKLVLAGPDSAFSVCVLRNEDTLKKYTTNAATYSTPVIADLSEEEKNQLAADWKEKVQPRVKAYWKTCIISNSNNAAVQFKNRQGLQYSFTGKTGGYIMKLCLSNSETENCVKDEGFSANFSRREFDTFFQKLATAFAAAHTDDPWTDIGQQLSLSTDTLYTLSVRQSASDKAKASKQDSSVLAYNDSLSAIIRLQREVPYYRFNQGLYEPAGKLSLDNATLYINDGFIYTISFTIDPAQAAGLHLIPAQAFGTRYNLKNNSFVDYMINRSSYGERGSFKADKTVKNNGTFREANRQLNLLVLANDKRLSNDNAAETPRYVVLPHELIHYSKPQNAPNAIFTAKETFLNFANKASFDSIRVIHEKSLYSFINLDVFTDLIGLFGNDKPNGLLQTELKADFYGFRRPLSQVFPSRARVVPLDKGEFFFRLSKLDNNLRYLDVLRTSDSSSATKYIHGINLLQYQSIYSGLRVNLLDIEYRGGSTAIQGELAFTRTPIRDTIVQGSGSSTVKVPEESGINSLLYSLGVNFRFNCASFLDVDVLPKFIWIQPKTSAIRLSGSEYSTLYPNTYLSLDKQRTRLFLMRGMITINLNDDKTRRFILRGDYYADVDQSSNSFWSVQAGYSADLNKFIHFN
ncbi:MAG TPA: hypothetical protein VG842_07600, partial [Sediminibacterium sp.]|nr:hypothetical protein [Sediminibacterium sp.]